MKKVKRIISLIMVTALVLTSLPLSFINASAGSVQSDASLVLNRPQASVIVTEVTRVAYEANSMKAPSGNNSVIVQSTLSGIPYLTSTRNTLGYAGETPAATTVVFTPGVELSEAPVLTCTNSTVRWTGPLYANGTYTWAVTGGTAMPGTTLVFNVAYSYSEVNPVTGREYSHNYNTSGTSFVEAIATPAGLYSQKRTYSDWGLGTTTKNRSYLASYILGKNTYGSIYNNGSPDGSVAFATSAWADGGSWSDEYGMMQKMDGSDASRDFNAAYNVDSDRPLSTVYFDKSMYSTLSDLNLRAVTTVMAQSDEPDEIVTVTAKNIYVLDGFVQTAEDSDEELSFTSDPTASAQLNITKPTGSLYYLASNFTSYFTGTGPSDNNTTADYTVVFQYQTSAGWDDVRVAHNYSLRVITYNKGALRTLVENIQSMDPSVMITDVGKNGFKGYNPQSWYFSSGWEAFSNALDTARSCLDKPNVSQTEIDNAYNNLSRTYNNLKLKTADYTIAGAYYNQAKNMNPESYTFASWARLQTLLDNYRSDYSVIYQPAVDKMGTDIKAAMDSLEEKPADYTEFNELVNTINNLAVNSEALYGKPADLAYSGWSNLVSVLTKSGCSYNELDGFLVENYLCISEQAKVDGYVILIQRALNALTVAGADYTAASKAESAYRVINKNYVVGDVEENLTAAYNALVALHGLDLTHQAEIDEATAELNYWLDNLEYKPADTTAAENLIAYAYGLDRSLYSDFSGVDAAIDNLFLKFELDIRYQNEINRATAALQSAIDQLLTNSADYSLVDEAIESVAERERLILEAYEDTYGFTAETFYSNWSSVAAAINSVVRGLDVTKQTQVDGYAAAINNALAALSENTADYTQVTALQNQAYTICTTGSSLYTQTSISNLLNVYMSVTANLPISRQAEVDGFAASIRQAIDDLQYLPADYSNVTAQLNNANAKLAADEAYSQAHAGYTLYTPESLADVYVAIAQVVDGLDIRYQTTVNGYAGDISAAISGLVYAPADYTAVYEALAAVPGDTSIYTALSLTTLNTVINGINYSYTADKQSTVDKYVTSIGNAIGKLKLKSADYSAVNAAINAVPSDSSLYTEDSWQALQDQLNAVVTGYDITRQSEVDLMAENINTARSLLAYKGADYTCVNNAKSGIPTDLSIYTDESVAALNAVLDAIDYYCSITQQATVNGYAAQINAAVEGLQVRSADYSELYSAVEEASEKLATGYYTDESAAALNAKISEVQYNLDITHQTEVENWTSDIVKATKDLVLKLADYTELQKILNLLDNSASEIYTITYINYNEVMELIADYRAQYVKTDVTIDRQSEVDEMASTLQGYIDSLVPAPSESFEFVGTAAVKEVDGVKYVYGFENSITESKFNDGGYTQYENVEVDIEKSSSRYIGTGSVITVTYSSGRVEEYIVVIFGDLDGNSRVTSKDADILFDSLSGSSDPLEGAYKLAADVYGTGRKNVITINSMDFLALCDVASSKLEIDRTTGKVVEM